MLKTLARLLLIGGLLFATAGSEAPVQARPLSAVGTVTQCNEAGLLAALDRYDTIYFNCSSNPAVIPVSRQIVIRKNTIIDGGGKVVLDGQGAYRIMKVNAYIELLLKDITLQNGRAQINGEEPRRGSGGAVLVDTWADVTFQGVRFLNNRADATGSMGQEPNPTSDICEGGGAVHLNGFNYAEVFDSYFSGNVGRNGAAINNLTADLVVAGTTFENNNAYAPRTGDPCGGGGAIYIDGASPTSQGGQQKISISNSIFRGNVTDRKGGAIFMYLYPSDGNFRALSDQVSIDTSTFESNRAESPTPGELGTGGGGAIDYQSSQYQRNTLLTIRNTTINNNHADHLGGGVWAENGPMELHNVTVVNNEAKNSKTSVTYNQGAGGGLMIGNGDPRVNGEGTRLIHVTIAGNTDNRVGGGIGHWGQTLPSQIRMANTIIASNSSEFAADNCSFTATNLGGNVQYPNKASGDRDCSGSITFGNPAFGTFDNHGGRTKTLAIGSGAARDRALATYCTGWTAKDQRGYGRNGACDSGAFEYGGVTLKPAAFIPLIRR